MQHEELQGTIKWSGSLLLQEVVDQLEEQYLTHKEVLGRVNVPPGLWTLHLQVLNMMFDSGQSQIVAPSRFDQGGAELEL